MSLKKFFFPLIHLPQDLLKITALENENKKYSLLDLVRTPKLRRLTAIAGTVWYGSYNKNVVMLDFFFGPF